MIAAPAVARFLTILLIATVLIAHATSVAAKVCMHQDAHAHALARQSSDRAVAAASLAEEAAAAVDSKKGSQSPGSSVHAPVDMLPAVLPMVVPPDTASVLPCPAHQAPLASASIPPPTRPPAA